MYTYEFALFDNLVRTEMLAEYRLRLRVRYDECDPMGFVHHSNYFRYFEIARTELFRASGGNYRSIEDSGLLVVVTKAECSFQQPARYDDEIAVVVKIDRITEAKIVQSYVVERQAQRLATGKVTLAVVDRQGVPQRIPAKIRQPSQHMSGESQPAVQPPRR